MSRTIILDRKQFPKCIQQFECVKGICIGNCIAIADPTSLYDGAPAHAHCGKDDHFGWICLRYKYILREKLTLLHEAAHLLVSDYPWHGKEWRAMVKKIGGTYKSYPSLSKRGIFYSDFSRNC
jgi:hypothetical protein